MTGCDPRFLAVPVALVLVTVLSLRESLLGLLVFEVVFALVKIAVVAAAAAAAVVMV